MRLVSTGEHALLAVSPEDKTFLIAGSQGEEGMQDGKRERARFNLPDGMTVDRAGNIVVVEFGNHAIRMVSSAGQVDTLASNGEAGFEGFADGQGAAARFKGPGGVVLATNGELLVSDYHNHAIRAVTAAGAVRTLAENWGQAGFEDGQGRAARFDCKSGMALDVDGSLLVMDKRNNAARRVTMAGAVSTVAGNGEAGFADGARAAARFNNPTDVVVGGNGIIAVAGRDNNRLRKIEEDQVTTLAGSTEAGRADGVGAGARFNGPCSWALDERGRLLVIEIQMM